MPDRFPEELVARLPEHLAEQRWFPGRQPPELSLRSSRRLWDGGGGHEMWQLLVETGGEVFQLVLGVRPDGETAEFLHGHEAAVLGSAQGVYAYDATCDGELAKVLLEVVSGGRESAARARPVGAEQSNTSIVYDDRLILKLFRHLRPGANPDVEVTTALAGAGFAHVAAPLVRWRDEEFDLAFGQQYLAGGTEGWALALTSLRDLYNGPDASLPADAGGDFSAEAGRLGRVTAEMHVTMERVFGTAPPAQSREVFASLVDSLPGRLERAGRAVGRDLTGAAGPLLERLRAIDDPGPAMRVHGDYHLGQVMRTDRGWFVLDFEGEPARPVAERVAPHSPFKDVTGMLRSFHYASRHALVERAQPDWEEMAPSALAWEWHNRQAFLDGYFAHPGVAALLPEAPVSAAVMSAYELDKALYEIDYELSHRPEWVPIPLDALERLVEG